MTGFMIPDKEHNMSNEPVALGGAIQGLLAAIISAALLFGWVDWSTEQVGGIMAVYVAVVAVITAAQRSKVTPVSEV